MSGRPRLLDLFCGAGGASMGYHRAGFDVVGVDKEPQPNYPFEFHQADALEFPLEGFDAIHASPPCQLHSSVTPDKRRAEHPDLIAPIRGRLVSAGVPYIIENVEGAPLQGPVTVCGSGLGLPIKRHRLFESNVMLMVPPCAHGGLAKQFDIFRHGEWIKSRYAAVYGNGGGKQRSRWGESMGIDWMNADELAQAIPPLYTEVIGSHLRSHLERPHQITASRKESPMSDSKPWSWTELQESVDLDDPDKSLTITTQDARALVELADTVNGMTAYEYAAFERVEAQLAAHDRRLAQSLEQSLDKPERGMSR